MNTNLLRLKQPKSTLISDIINQLPIDYFKRNDTTFLTLCIGDGEIQRCLYNILKSYGHSDINITKRIFGIVNDKYTLNYINNINKLVGTFYIYNDVDTNQFDIDKIKDILDNMKFDAVIDNPPYQTQNPGETKTHPIWDKFVELSFNLCK